MSEALPRGEYTKFVTALVKWQQTPQEDLVHAALGIVGEVIELQFSTSRENTLEELGDIEFYLKHYWIVVDRLKQRGLRMMPIVAHATPITWAQCMTDLTAGAGELVDYAKKAWVYGKAYELIPFESELHRLSMALDGLYDHLGIDKQSIRSRNVTKLKRRYPTGYTDAAANARADKVA